MKNFSIILLASLICFSTNIFAQSLKNNKQARVSYTQSLEPDAKVSMTDKSVSRKSHVFFRKVNGDQLNKGVDFLLDAESAVVQITPLDAVKNGNRMRRARVPQGLVLSNSKQKRRVTDDSIALHRKSQALREAYPEFYGRAHAMEIPKDMGRGKFTLKGDGSATKDEEYVLYVLDKNSDISLDVHAPKARFSRNETLSINASVNSSNDVKVESITTELVAPNGKRYRIPGRVSNGRYRAAWPINVDTSVAPGELWEVEVRSRVRNARNEVVERVAVVAADIYEPTAALNRIDTTENTVALSLTVDKESRYEARVLVYGFDYDGKEKPALLSYQAEWLQPGERELVLSVNEDKLLGSGLSAPFAVHSVQLLDQGSLSVLEKQQGHWPLK